MVIPEQLQRSVAFICYRDNDSTIRFAGTCFFIGLAPNSKQTDGSEGFYSYIITAKHVIVAIKEKSKDGKAILRVNLKNGSFDYVETMADDWFSNPDEPSDVAILSWSPPSTEIYEITHIMSDMIQTENVKHFEKACVGDDVFIVGLFANHTGKKRNTPIVRAGNIAMLPDKDEKIENRYFGDMEAYLIESRSIGGLSGSPVYVHMTDPRIDENGHVLYLQMRYIYLLGLIHGHYDIELPQKDNIVEDSVRKEAINMGVAIVVPSQKIKDVLYHPEIIKARGEKI